MREQTPSCPRCGYDQSGAVAAWERIEPAACPLGGVCSECGLGFEWCDILNPRLGANGLFFELAEHKRVRAYVATAWRALKPGRFWSWVRMEHPVRPARLAMVVPAAALVAGASLGIVLVLGWTFEMVRGLVLGRFWGPIGWSDLFWSGRATGWTQYFTEWPQWWPRPWLALSLLAVVLMPLTFLLLPETLRRGRVRRRHLLRVWAYGLVSLPVALAMPVVLMLVVRAAILVDLRRHGAGYWLKGLGVWMGRQSWVLGVGCVAVWMVWWWWAATGRYLRLPRAGLVAGVMAVLAMLLAAAVIAAMPGGMVWLVADQ